MIDCFCHTTHRQRVLLRYTPAMWLDANRYQNTVVRLHVEELCDTWSRTQKTAVVRSRSECAESHDISLNES